MKNTPEFSRSLPVVHIHMGPNIPPYFWETVRQTRRFHVGRIICVLPPAEVDNAVAEELQLTVISNESFDDVEMIRSVNKVSWLNERYGGGGFWHYTMLRLFVLEALMQRYSIQSCLHIENDVLIYATPDTLVGRLEACYSGRCAATPLGPSAGCTAAVMYVSRRAALTEVCKEMLSLLSVDEAQVRRSLGADMVNEMVLLGVIRHTIPELLDVLPVAPYPQTRLPSVKRVFKPWARPFLRLADRIYPKVLNRIPAEEQSKNLPKIGYLFDPAFWGQYVGGTPHGDGPGFSAAHHWIGHDLCAGRYSIAWEIDELGRKVPFVTAHEDPNAKWPIFNLHIHSKKITDFV